jgi:hypothetical protein
MSPMVSLLVCIQLSVHADLSLAKRSSIRLATPLSSLAEFLEGLCKRVVWSAEVSLLVCHTMRQAFASGDSSDSSIALSLRAIGIFAFPST